jgi:hypothetical protein
MGGTVFWVDATGTHGLIVAEADQSTSVVWDPGAPGVTNVFASGIGAGKMNSSVIVSVITAVNQPLGPASSFAANICTNYCIGADGSTPCGAVPASSPQGYADWYLPSIMELQLLVPYGSLTANQFYWSSNEIDQNTAYAYETFGGTPTGEIKSGADYVRCIRSF